MDSEVNLFEGHEDFLIKNWLFKANTMQDAGRG